MSRALATSTALLLAATLTGPARAQQPLATLPGVGPSPALPAPGGTPSAVNFSTLVGWPEGAAPTASEGFAVSRFDGGGLDHPRWLHVLPNGDVLVAESRTEMPKNQEDPAILEGLRRSGAAGTSADRITLLRDADRDGRAEERHALLEGLNQPFGMALLGGHLYVANTDALARFPYREGQNRIEGAGERVLGLPAGGYNNHWTRNVAASPDGSRLYVTVGSASNVAEYGMAEEERRAAILEVRPDGTGERVFAGGLRNPNGLAFEPVTGALWTAVNERDGLGDDLVPDYITSVREGGFYGWPFSYYGQNEDPRLKGQRPDLVAAAIPPDYALGAHTASLGLAFYEGASFPARYRGGAFVGQHGSWNRAAFSGYKVVFVPFRDGRPAGPPEDFLTGFMADAATGAVRGRPAGVAVAADGALLVADGAGNAVWRVQADASAAAAR